MGRPMPDRGYDPNQPMADTGDLFTDLINSFLDVFTNGGVETGDTPAVNSPEWGDRK